MQRDTRGSIGEVSWAVRLAAPIAFVVSLSLAVGSILPRWDYLTSDALFRNYAVLFVSYLCIPVAASLIASWQTRGHERRAWGFLALGTAAMAVSDIYAVASGGSAGPPIVSGTAWPTTVWIASFAAYGASLLGFVDTPWNLTSVRARNLIDISYAVLLSTIFAFAIAVFPEFGTASDRPMDVVLPHFAAMACGVGMLAYIGSRRPRVRSWHVLLTAAAVCVVSGGTFGFASLASGSADLLVPRLPYMPWMLAYGLVATAAIARVSAQRDTPREYVMYVDDPGFTPGLVATVGLFLALPLFVHQTQSWTGDRSGYMAYSATVAMICVVAVTRNVLLSVENSQLRRQSTTDPLTGLSNHRHFHERLAEELVRSKREGIPLSVAIIDVDDFDRVNDIYGHHTGDRRLCAIAEGLVADSRGFDIACRVGGDEFALIMPNADPVEAYRACLRTQERMARSDGVCPLPVSLSVGVASFPEHADEHDALVRKADGALYWAKYHGRNQIVLFDPEIVLALSPEQRISLLEEESYLNMVQMLATAVDARDPYTKLHSSNVASLSVELAKDLGLDQARCGLLETAALLHDVGKIGVTDHVLRKPGRLTEEEMDHIKGHPSLAVHILKSIPRQEILPWVAAHHERWDGGGYPEGLSGEDIPLEARILALCDAYDAMTTDRPYRAAFTCERARSEVVMGAGTQFDPSLARRFVEMLERGTPVESGDASRMDEGGAHA